ncbi:hypothetical protein [Streptomyces parvulus]
MRGQVGGEHPVVPSCVRSRGPRPRPQAVGQRQAGRGIRRGEVEDRAGQQRAHVQDPIQEERGVKDADLGQVDELRPGPPAGRLEVAAKQARQRASDRAGPAERAAGVGVDGHDQLPQQARDVGVSLSDIAAPVLAYPADDFVEPRELLPAAAAALRRGGRLVFSTLAHHLGGELAHPDVQHTEIGAKTPEGAAATMHRWVLQEQVWSKLLDEAGFTRISTETLPGEPGRAPLTRSW